LVAWTTGQAWNYEPPVDDVTGLIICAEFNSNINFSGVLAMVMASVKMIAIHFALFVNLFAINAVKATQGDNV
jgi:hypothetical protein